MGSEVSTCNRASLSLHDLVQLTKCFGAVERFFNTLKCQNPHKQNHIQRNAKREYGKCFTAPISTEDRPCKKMKQDDVNDEETKSIPQNYNQRTKKIDMNKDEIMKSSPQKCSRTMKMENVKDEEKKSIAYPPKKQGFSEQYLSSQRPSMLTAQSVRNV